MLNHRLIDPPREPEKFVEAAVHFLKIHAKNKKVFCALSGGIDSSCVYLLLKQANINTIPVFLDHGLMRIIRGQEEREYIKDLFLGIMSLKISFRVVNPKIVANPKASPKEDNPPIKTR